MENIECRVIYFRQSKEEVKHIYFLLDKQIEMRDYYYDRSMGAFAAIQQAGHLRQLTLNCPVIVATSNPRYPDIKRVPPAFEKAYRDGTHTPTTARIRI